METLESNLGFLQALKNAYPTPQINNPVISDATSEISAKPSNKILYICGGIVVFGIIGYAWYRHYQKKKEAENQKQISKEVAPSAPVAKSSSAEQVSVQASPFQNSPFYQRF